MTNYTERFRTLSIPQMQRLLWVCCTYIAKRDAVQAHRIETILAPPTPFNIDPADEALVDAAMVKREAGLNVTPMARSVDADSSVMRPAKSINEPSRIIRSGDLVVGKRYRIVELASWRDSHLFKVGAVLTCCDNSEESDMITFDARQRKGETYWFVNSDRGATHVTAVELVEDEQHPRGFDINAEECQEDAASCDCLWHENARRAEESHHDPDPTIIRAAEGVTLEPGEYISDASGASYSIARVFSAKRLPLAGVWAFELAPSVWVTAVRRVDPKPASEPVAPAAGGELVGAEPGFINYCTICCWMGFNSSCPNCNGDRGLRLYVRASAPPQQPAERVETVAASSEVLTGAGERVFRELITQSVEETVRRRDAALAVAKLTVENATLRERLEATELERDNLLADFELRFSERGDIPTPELVTARERARQAEQEAVRLRGELESARAGLDSKACGELIATVTQGVGTANQLRASAAFAALDKLAAMLGVEVA